VSVNWRLRGESNIRSVFPCERLPNETGVLIPVEFSKFLKIRATLSHSAKLEVSRIRVLGLCNDWMKVGRIMQVVPDVSEPDDDGP